MYKVKIFNREGLHPIYWDPFFERDAKRYFPCPKDVVCAAPVEVVNTLLAWTSESPVPSVIANLLPGQFIMKRGNKLGPTFDTGYIVTCGTMRDAILHLLANRTVVSWYELGLIAQEIGTSDIYRFDQICEELAQEQKIEISTR